MFILALELTKNESLTFELEQIMLETKELQDSGIQAWENEYENPDENYYSETENSVEEFMEMDDFIYQERFEALCSTLTQKEQQAYCSYGDDFAKGFVDLNRDISIPQPRNFP